MRRKHVHILMATIFVLLCILLRLVSVKGSDSISKTEQYELEFYSTLLVYMESNSVIPIREVVPVSWNKMKVFPAYSTKDDKIDYVGYRYADDLQDITHEDVISLVFLWDDSLVYYVDVLVPRMFQIQKKENGPDELWLSNTYHVQLDEAITGYPTKWAYYNYVDEAFIGENPYFEIYNKGNSNYKITLKTVK